MIKNAAIDLMERGWVPDPLVRAGIRSLLRGRLDAIQSDATRQKAEVLDTLRQAPVAVHTAQANTQHYEVPTAFFQTILGPRLKYSSCLFPDAAATLAEAEEAMLQLCADRAQLEDGQDVLELGCGWGSFCLWIAEHYPNSRVLAVSNSATQRAHILGEARTRGLANLDVRTVDVTEFTPDQTFDRIVSVEMFEHMRNYTTLMQRIAEWLNPDGKLFVHIFCHRDLPYLFETDGAENWMGRYFFTGGTMPSFDLLPALAAPLRREEAWQVNGEHYSRTLEAWLEQLDSARNEVIETMRETYGASEARRWMQRWRMFLLACSELFRYRGGEEWFVAHYRFGRSGDPA